MKIIYPIAFLFAALNAFTQASMNNSLQSQIDKLEKLQSNKIEDLTKLLSLKEQYLNLLQDSISKFNNSNSELPDSIFNVQLDEEISEAHFNSIVNRDSDKSMYSSVHLEQLLILKSKDWNDQTKDQSNKIESWTSLIEIQNSDIQNLKKKIQSIKPQETEVVNKKSPLVAVQEKAKPEDLVYNSSSIYKQIITASQQSGVSYQAQFDKDSKLFADRKAFMAWPLSNSKIKHRYTKEKGSMTFTSDEDVVTSVCQGQVIYSKKLGPNNYTILIMHDDNYYSIYSGLQSSFVSYGQKIIYQEQIGKAYKSNQGVHEIEFEIWKDKSSIDPIHWLKNG